MRTNVFISVLSCCLFALSFVAKADDSIPSSNPSDINTNSVETVISDINAIGVISLTNDCYNKIKKARKGYRDLSIEQKKSVDNLAKLDDAEKKYQRLAKDKNNADKVVLAINTIGTVSLTPECNNKIAKARETYDALTKDQKELVSNYSTLQNCETLFRTLDSNATAEEDMFIAMVAIRTINDIGDVEFNDACKKRIDTARAAYDGLSQSQKKLVTNFSLLSSAESKYQSLEELQAQYKKESKNGVILCLFCVLFVIFIIAIVVIVRNRKKKKMENMITPSAVESIDETYKESLGIEKEESEAGSFQQTKTLNGHNPEEVNGNDDGGEPNVIPSTEIVDSAEWIVVGASVKGNGHIQSNMPCQDNHIFESLGNGWGITIVSDGAGSAEHSELGSRIVVSRGVFHFKKLLEREGWMEKQILPTDVEWLRKSYSVLKDIRNDVIMLAKKNDMDVRSLYATCLVVIYSPFGLLSVHVGDGRMGYKSMTGEWKSMMTPHKGEEANQTIFLVSDFWSIPNYEMSGVLVPESIVVREPVKAFALMSDGCENTAWQCTAFNSDMEKYFDRNLPFTGFFNPLEETLVTFSKENVPETERQAKWFRFIESGTSGFVKEQDDKTMIFAVNVAITK